MLCLMTLAGQGQADSSAAENDTTNQPGQVAMPSDTNNVALAIADTVDPQENDSLLVADYPDSAFFKAQNFAFNEEYDKADNILKKLNKTYPQNLDFWLFRARMNSWRKNYNPARRQVSRVIALDSSRTEAYKVLANVERYDEKYDTAIGICKYALKKIPKDEFFMVTQAQAEAKAMYYQDALKSVNKGLDAHPDNEELQDLKVFLLNQLFQEGIAVGAGIDYFTADFDPWINTMVQYGHFTNIGPLIGRVNMARRFGDLYGAQLEFDFYPRINRRQYFYLNAGWSPTAIFPLWRFGAEYYSMLPGSKHWEGSAGIRNLIFGVNNSTFMITGSLGYYWNDNYLQFRPFFINEEGGIGSSYNLVYRHFNKGMGDYWQLTAGFGNIPDQEIISVQGVVGRQITNLQNYYVGYAIQKIVSEKLYVRGDLKFTRQEKFSDPNNFLNIISMFVTLGYRM